MRTFFEDVTSMPTILSPFVFKVYKIRDDGPWSLEIAPRVEYNANTGALSLVLHGLCAEPFQMDNKSAVQVNANGIQLTLMANPVHDEQFRYHLVSQYLDNYVLFVRHLRPAVMSEATAASVATPHPSMCSSIATCYLSHAGPVQSDLCLLCIPGARATSAT